MYGTEARSMDFEECKLHAVGSKTKPQQEDGPLSPKSLFVDAIKPQHFATVIDLASRKRRADGRTDRQQAGMTQRFIYAPPV